MSWSAPWNGRARRAAPPTPVRRVLDRALTSLAAVAVTSALVILSLTLVSLVAVAPGLQRAVDAQARLSQAFDGMLDQETALRAYVITHETTFLQPDAPGQALTAAATSQLAIDLSGDAHALQSLISVTAAQQAWESGWAQPARELDTGGDINGFLAGGKTLFDAYRTAQSQAAQIVTGDINDTLTASQRLAILVFGVATVSLLAKLRGWLASRRRIHAEVFAPVGHLLATFDRLGAGSLDVEAPVAGPEEFRRIGEGVNRMVATLRDDRDHLIQSELDVTLANERLTKLVETARHIAGSLSLRYVISAVGEAAVGLGAARSVVWVLDANGQWVKAAYDSAGPHGRAAGIEAVELGAGLVGRAARYGRWITGTDDPTGGAPVNACALPMIVGARVVGVIEALCADAVTELSPEVLEVLDTLASQAATAIEAARLYEEVDQRSRTDPLTGLANRHGLDRELSRAVAQAERYQRPLAVAMIDVDHFKLYNDSFGHQAGDEALQEVANLLQQRVRESDGVYRYGGEEMVVLLPETDIDGGVALMDRVRASLQERFAAPSSRAPLTISVGVSAFPTHAIDARSLIEAADIALYRSKAGGRNRVTAAEMIGGAAAVPSLRA